MSLIFDVKYSFLFVGELFASILCLCSFLKKKSSFICVVVASWLFKQLLQRNLPIFCKVFLSTFSFFIFSSFKRWAYPNVCMDAQDSLLGTVLIRSMLHVSDYVTLSYLNVVTPNYFIFFLLHLQFFWFFSIMGVNTKICHGCPSGTSNSISLQFHWPEGINVSLFSSSADFWVNYLACRVFQSGAFVFIRVFRAWRSGVC